MSKLKPIPKAISDLDPTLKILIDYGTLKPKNEQRTEFSVVMDPKTNEPETKELDRSSNDIKQFSEGFRKRVKKKDPLDPVVATDLMPTDWSSDPRQVKDEKKAEEKLNKLKEEFDSLSESEQNSPKAKALEKSIKKSEADLKEKKRYRTVPKPVLILLNRLRDRNTDWSAGTYVGHSWGEFSVDVFLKAEIDVNAPGFWQRDKVSKFFDDLEASAEEKTSIGRFAWRAIYNDDSLANEINKKYGNNRVIHVPHHGPAPDNLHIHLDITPVDLKKDEVTGYEVKGDRIHLLKDNQ